ncbi:uncharacterized protein [Channa argus]|uniref:uncharacterized protein n=1 Tax=Channa argus TaxID=215402 RepID=UPI0035230C6B
MPLEAFSFPFPETRFIRAGNLIYKFKIRGGSSYSGNEKMEGSFSQELENIIRTVIGNLDSLQPFSTTHVNVFPYKKHWEGVSKVMCKHGEKKLRVYPFILILYLEKNSRNGKQAEEKLSPEDEISHNHCCVSEPQSKRFRRDLPLEDDTLKDLTEDAESTVSAVGRLHMDSPPAETGAKKDPGHADKKETMEFHELKSGDSAVTGSESSGKVQSGTIQDQEVEQEEDEEEENPDSVPGAPVRSGILTRLARLV